jgi:peptide deformylase
MVREILIWPDPRLKEKSAKVTAFGEQLQKLVDDMFETMYAAEGVGLAAPQVGVLQRLLVIDTSVRQEGQKPLVFINPEIVHAEGKAEYTEGCLSIPGEAEDTGVRAEKITCNALDRHGKPFTVHADGLLAIAIQHEMDHLEGVLFVDYLSSLKRGMIKKRMERYKADQAADAKEKAEPPEEPEKKKRGARAGARP